MKLPSENLSTELDDFPSGSPVRVAPGHATPEDGVGLCLSGGGYRAMLFHVGLLARLNDAGRLPGLDRISSVSGGSITAGALAVGWSDLAFDSTGVATRFDEVVTEPLRRVAHTRIDVGAVLGGAGSPFQSISDRVVSKLDRLLFGGATLQDLPDVPRFVFNSTNIESGVLMRFQKPYLADYRVGMVRNPTLLVAEAVTASSSFPPFLSPMELDLGDAVWEDVDGTDLTTPGYRSEILLSDGGVYDNMGIESVWKCYKTVLVSDAGGLFAADEDPARDWGRHLVRVLQIMDSQVRALRRRHVVDGFKDASDPHDGFYVSTASDLARFPQVEGRPFIDVSHAVTERLARIHTRLSDMPDDEQELLINWGYAVADAALVAFMGERGDPPPLPYPDRPLG